MNHAESESARRLHNLPASTLLKDWTNIGDSLSAQFTELQRNPTASGSEQLAANLQGTAQLILRIREGLMADVEFARDND